MPEVERDLRRIRQRLLQEGWYVARDDGRHEVFKHVDRSGRVVVPRHRGDLAYGTARSIALQAGWI
jgi:predicted RNA binding protein YcfA (HicA-like mRNA interferase family)